MVTKKTIRRRKQPLAPGAEKTLVLNCKVSPAEMALANDLATLVVLDRSEVVRRALNVVAANPELITPTFEKLQKRLDEADGLWRYWTTHDITENEDDWAAFSNAVRNHLEGKPVDARFVVKSRVRA